MERMATRGFGDKKIANTLGLPEATTKRWLRRLRSDGDVAPHNIGRLRAVEASLCVMSFCMFRLTSLGVSSRLWVHGCKDERVRAAALINAWISVEPRCTVASVRKRLQASGIECGRSSVQEYMKAEHWPAKQVICG